MMTLEETDDFAATEQTAGQHGTVHSGNELRPRVFRCTSACKIERRIRDSFHR